jgi:hypothetical protein
MIKYTIFLILDVIVLSIIILSLTHKSKNCRYNKNIKNLSIELKKNGDYKIYLSKEKLKMKILIKKDLRTNAIQKQNLLNTEIDLLKNKIELIKKY